MNVKEIKKKFKLNPFLEYEDIQYLINICEAADNLWHVKGRYHSQVAMCKLGELLGYPVVYPANGSFDS